MSLVVSCNIRIKLKIYFMKYFIHIIKFTKNNIFKFEIEMGYFLKILYFYNCYMDVERLLIWRFINVRNYYRY